MRFEQLAATYLLGLWSSFSSSLLRCSQDPVNYHIDADLNGPVVEVEEEMREHWYRLTWGLLIFLYEYQGGDYQKD